MSLTPDMTRDKQNWPLTMTEASHIARLPRHAGSDADIAKEYGVSEQLIRQIRSGEGYKGVRLS